MDCLFHLVQKLYVSMPRRFFFFVFVYTLSTIHIHNIICIVAGKPARVDVEKTVFFLWLYEFIAIDLQKQQLEREREREREMTRS